MDRRPFLQDELQKVVPNVYFQPPESIRLKYPCIIYSRSNSAARYADDSLYLNKFGYDIVLIDENPDSVYVNKLLQFKFCKFDNVFSKDGLYHYRFRLYF